jgi:hypothetical protein
MIFIPVKYQERARAMAPGAKVAEFYQEIGAGAL